MPSDHQLSAVVQRTSLVAMASSPYLSVSLWELLSDYLSVFNRLMSRRFGPALMPWKRDWHSSKSAALDLNSDGTEHQMERPRRDLPIEIRQDEHIMLFLTILSFWDSRPVD